MKISCGSASFARSLHAGALTQLEWIDRCADLAVDGVDFGAAHFPRLDADHLAHLKKLCCDRGLTVASVEFDVPLGEGDVDAQIAGVCAWIDRAAALGAPVARLWCGAAAGSPGIAWRELIRALRSACAAAKRANVTLALQPAEGSMVAGPADAKRALKECDSAWLRLCLRAEDVAGPLAGEWLATAGEAVEVVCASAAGPVRAGLASLARLGYIGFVTLAGDGDDADVARAIRELRGAVRGT